MLFNSKIFVLAFLPVDPHRLLLDRAPDFRRRSARLGAGRIMAVLWLVEPFPPGPAHRLDARQFCICAAALPGIRTQPDTAARSPGPGAGHQHSIARLLQVRRLRSRGRCASDRYRICHGGHCSPRLPSPSIRSSRSPIWSMSITAPRRAIPSCNICSSCRFFRS